MQGSQLLLVRCNLVSQLLPAPPAACGPTPPVAAALAMLAAPAAPARPLSPGTGLARFAFPAAPAGLLSPWFATPAAPGGAGLATPAPLRQLAVRLRLFQLRLATPAGPLSPVPGAGLASLDLQFLLSCCRLRLQLLRLLVELVSQVRHLRLSQLLLSQGSQLLLSLVRCRSRLGLALQGLQSPLLLLVRCRLGLHLLSFLVELGSQLLLASPHQLSSWSASARPSCSCKAPNSSCSCGSGVRSPWLPTPTCRSCRAGASVPPGAGVRRTRSAWGDGLAQTPGELVHPFHSAEARRARSARAGRSVQRRMRGRRMERKLTKRAPPTTKI